MKVVQPKKQGVSIPTKPRGRPTKVTLEMQRLRQEKKKLEEDKKKLEEQKQREEEKKREEEKRKREEEKRKLEEDKERLEEQKRLAEEKKRLEKEKKKYEEEKKKHNEEKKKREEEKKKEKKKQDKENKTGEEDTKRDEEKKKREEGKKHDENRRRTENDRNSYEEQSWKRGRDDRRRGDDNRSRSRYRDYTPEIHRRGYRRTSRSPPFRCTRQPHNFEEIDMLRAKIRQLEDAVAQGRLHETIIKHPGFQQPLQPCAAVNNYEDNEVVKLKTRIRHYQENNADLKKKLDYSNKRIAELERSRMPAPLPFHPPSNSLQDFQPSGYYYQNQQKFY